MWHGRNEGPPVALQQRYVTGPCPSGRCQRGRGGAQPALCSHRGLGRMGQCDRPCAISIRAKTWWRCAALRMSAGPAIDRITIFGDTTNVALDHRIAFSAESPGYPAWQAVDADTQTCWRAEGLPAVAGSGSGRHLPDPSHAGGVSALAGLSIPGRGEGRRRGMPTFRWWTARTTQRPGPPWNRLPTHSNPHPHGTCV